jgi:hypothetical protein
MQFILRKIRRPTALRHLVRRLYGQKEAVPLNLGSFPSQHIICAGAYSPVFARLAAESALAACPAELRPDFKLYVHVDGVSMDKRRELVAWLREVPGLEITEGLFGITSRDKIPGKWHQTTINDVVKVFSNEKHLGFIDADLFLSGTSWFDLCSNHLVDDLYGLCAALRPSSMTLDGRDFYGMTTSLFTVNTAAHLALNQQRFNKDMRAIDMLREEFPAANIAIKPAMDTMIGGSLRAQAHGLRVEDIDPDVEYCHVGGFSHLRADKFSDQGSEYSVDTWLARFRVMVRVLALFDKRGWEKYVETGYRHNIDTAMARIKGDADLSRRFESAVPSRDELVFNKLFS